MDRKKVEEIKEDVKKFKKVGRKKFGIEKIIIFGSVARGKIDWHSDVDLIVVSKYYGRRDVFRIVPQLYELWHEELKIDMPIDFLLFNVKEFNKLKKEVSIVSTALEEGIEV